MEIRITGLGLFEVILLKFILFENTYVELFVKFSSEGKILGRSDKDIASNVNFS